MANTSSRVNRACASFPRTRPRGGARLRSAGKSGGEVRMLQDAAFPASSKAPPPTCEIAIYSHYQAAIWLLPLPLADLRPLIAAMLAVTSLRAVELHLLDDAALAAMNAEYMSACGCTNILSFPGSGTMPGSLFLSLDTWARESLLYGQPPASHLVRLLAHGLAHLTGLDHGEAMARLEEKCRRAGEKMLPHLALCPNGRMGANV